MSHKVAYVGIVHTNRKTNVPTHYSHQVRQVVKAIKEAVAWRAEQ